MADNKKYYYLKLKEDFFDSDEMLLLQGMKDGYLYSDILMKGTCGSPYSNTNGKEPFKFLGIEFALGQYVVRSDVILNGVYDAEADTYQQEIYTCYDCKYFATAINEHYKKLGYVIPDSGNAWKYIKNLGFDVNFPHIRMASEYGGDSNKRFGDAVHTGTRANGTREFLSLGPLWYWSFAGLRFASLNPWLGGGSSFSHWKTRISRRLGIVYGGEFGGVAPKRGSPLIIFCN